MFKIEKQVVLYRKTDTSYFARKNSKVLPVGFSKIGPSINAVKSITLQTDMLKKFMPKILGISSDQTDFTRRVDYYWNSLSVNVPENGKVLQIGLIYDFDSEETKKAIKEHLKDKDEKPVAITSSKHLANYVEANVKEEDKHRFATPIEPADYLLWRYCLNYGDVANSLEDRDNSNKIRFYIHNQAEQKRIESEKFELRKKAGKIYLDVIDDLKKVEKYLLALGQGAVMSTMDDIDKFKLFEKAFNENPQDILDISKDKQLDEKAFIEECIIKGVLRRLPNSSVIVNSTDNTPIGDNLENAIAFLKLESNLKVKNEIEGRLRTLPS